MCLATLNSGKSGKRRGYKIIFAESGKFYTGVGACGASRVELSTLGYVTDPRKRPIENDGFAYSSGFHIFCSAEDALTMHDRYEPDGEVWLVAFRQERAWGEVRWTSGGSTTTVVARQVKLLERIC